MPRAKLLAYVTFLVTHYEKPRVPVRAKIYSSISHIVFLLLTLALVTLTLPTIKRLSETVCPG